MQDCVEEGGALLTGDRGIGGQTKRHEMWTKGKCYLSDTPHTIQKQ